MIVFMDNPNLIPYLQSRFQKRNVAIFNLSSLYSGYIDATDLITKISPINNTGLPMPEFVNSIQFDIQYMNSIINTPELFYQLIRIVDISYEGNIVIVLVQRDPYRDAVMESLIKLIQQRYGYNCWIIEDQYDLDCIMESTFTPMGLMTLDQDIKLYDDLYKKGLAGPILNTGVNVE
jgi:hypothetical protein